MRGKQIAKNENQRLLVSEETEQEKGQIAKNKNKILLVSEETEQEKGQTAKNENQRLLVSEETEQEKGQCFHLLPQAVPAGGSSREKHCLAV